MIPLHHKIKLARHSSLQKRSHLLLGVIAGIILTSLSGCQLERFRHEKYSCQNSNLDIAEIVIRNAKKGKEVKIFGDDGTLKLNRKTGALSIPRRNRYTRTSCKLSVFTL